MRGVVIAKILVLALVGIYLATGLTRSTEEAVSARGSFAAEMCCLAPGVNSESDLDERQIL